MLQRKYVYPYEYMDEWEKFNKTLVPEKDDLYSSLNMEDITDSDNIHGEKGCKYFDINILGEYRGLYLKSNTLHLLMFLKTLGKCA